MRAEGRVVHLGRSTAVAEGRLYDVDDRLYAVGSTTPAWSCTWPDERGFAREGRQALR